MPFNRVLSFFVVFIQLVNFSFVLASTPKTRTFKTQDDFENGKPTHVTINSRGEVALAPSIEELYKSEAAFVWAAATDSRQNLFVAGGASGQIFKVDKQGKAEAYFEVPESQVYALAVDGDNNLFVASSPNGKVYKVRTAGQSPEEALLFDPSEVYIWSLAVDRNGNLYVATGDSGNIYKIDKSGKSSLFYASDDSHVRKIVFDKSGNLIAATANKGLVLRINSAGNAFVLYDSPLVEITDLFVDDSGNIYAAATGEAQAQRRQARAVAAAQDEQQDDDGDAEDNEVSSVMQQVVVTTSGPSQRGEFYRISPDGVVRDFQTLKSERIYSVGADKSGNILLGAGEEGRLYMMDDEGDFTLVTKLDELQVTWLGRDNNGSVLIGTSNTGKVYRLGSEVRREGSFVSEVVDAGVLANWGAINWQSDVPSATSLTVQTRSGNSEEVDKTWSDWSEAYTVTAGSAIESPAARYLQVQVMLNSKDGRTTPRLKELTFSYLQKNVAPFIRQIYVHDPGEYFPDSDGSGNRLSGGTNGQNGYQNSSYGRKSYQKGYRSASWIVQDDNGDDQIYNLYYKGVAESNWRVLVEDFKNVVYSWDSELMPDGEYELKLETADTPANPPAMALKSDKLSLPFIVDNTGPQVSQIQAKQEGDTAVISFKVSDAFNTIQSVEYGINAEKWLLVYPVDGICDSKVETFEVKIKGVQKGETSLVIKALDSVSNIGYGKTTISL